MNGPRTIASAGGSGADVHPGMDPGLERYEDPVVVIDLVFVGDLQLDVRDREDGAVDTI